MVDELICHWKSPGRVVMANVEEGHNVPHVAGVGVHEWGRKNQKKRVSKEK